jgi:hypothetical protein
MQEAHKAAKEEFDTIMAAKDEELKKVRDGQAAAQKAVVEEKQNKSKEFLESIQTNDKLSQDIENYQKQIAEMTDAAKKEREKGGRELRDFEIKYQQLKDKQPLPNLLQHDTPKGKIVSLDRSGSIAYINLGSADNVRPQLTFSVVGKEVGGRSNRQPKASLEVANVIGPHLSAAQVTRVFDPGRNPIVTGDLLFNPAWSPALRQHIAVAGLIDLTGDGRDDLPDFIRLLERQGIVVDAYLDLKDDTIKGKGMTFQTDYLVKGDIPQIGTQLIISEEGKSDVKTQRQLDIHARVIEMEKEAARLGITVVPLRRFVTMVGLKVPKGGQPAEFNLYRPAAPVTGETPMPKEDQPKEVKEK